MLAAAPHASPNLSANPVSTMTFDVETDILVIGGGGGGLVAALAARQNGADVALLERSERLGGNTALSSGSVPGAGTRFQAAAGIVDSWQELADDIMRRTENTAPRDLVEALARESAPLVEWLADEASVPIELTADLPQVGHSIPRMHAPAGRQGYTLVNALEAAASAAGVALTPGNPVTSLLCAGEERSGAPRVVGVAVGEGHTRYTVGARKVILAANGFGANRTMLREYIPEIADAPYFGHPGNRGDAIGWAAALGARLLNMGAYQGHASVAEPSGALLSWAAIERGGILVDGSGARFIDETLGYSGCASAALARCDGLAYVLFDAAIHDYLADKSEDFRRIVHFGGVIREVGVDDLAARAGIEAARLAATLEEYNDAAAKRVVDPFGRTQFGGAPLVAPYSLARVRAGLFHTQGGVDVDRNGRVRRTDGRIFENLYAVGGVAVGVSGAHGGRGYCSANGLLAALGLGRLAGRHAAAGLSKPAA